MSDLTVEEVITRIFTTPNPETSSPPPAQIAWALFRNQTVFLTQPTDELPADATPDTLARASLKTLIRFGPPVAGTPSADFTVSRLPWFPDAHVYMVAYDDPNLVNIVIADAEMTEVGAGLLGRAARTADAERPSVGLLRDFGGNSYRVQAKQEIGRIDYSD